MSERASALQELPQGVGRPTLRTVAALAQPVPRVRLLLIAVGAYNLVLGAQMLVAPHQFDGPLHASLRAHLPLWGAALLLGGLALISGGLIARQRWLRGLVHLVGGGVTLLLAAAFAATGSWFGVALLGMQGIGTIVGPQLPTAPAGPGQGRATWPWTMAGDLFSTAAGLAMGLSGLAALLAPEWFVAPHFALIQPWLAWCGGSFLLAGAALLFAQFRPLARGAHCAVHLLAATLLVAWLAPVHASIDNLGGVAFYAWNGSLLAAAPWLGQRLDRFDGGSLRSRLTLTMAALAALPMVLAFAAMAAHQEAVAWPTAAADMHAETLRDLAFALLLSGMAIAAVCGWVVARWLAAPLRRLTLATRAAGAGAEDTALPPSHLTEMDTLSADFAEMRARLAAHEADLRRSQHLLQEILEHSPALIYVKDPEGRYLLTSRRFREVTELSEDRALVGAPEEGSASRDLAAIFSADRGVPDQQGASTFDEAGPGRHGGRTYLSHKFSLLDPTGAPYGTCGISSDITERVWLEALLETERRVLEMTARGVPFAAVLETLAHTVEELHGEGASVSILICDQDGTQLRHGAAPGLPAAYNAACNGIPIAEGVGSCGTAAFRRERVIVGDIAQDALWEGHRDLALQHGLRACWSTPILAVDGHVLGTFALYYREPRTPSPDHLRMVDIVRRTAGVIIERKRVEDERARLLANVENAEARYRNLFEGTAEAILVIAPDGRYLDVNRAAVDLTGYSADELRGMRTGDLSPTPEKVREAWSRIAHERGFRGDSDLRRRDGTIIPVATLLTSVEVPGGPVYVSAVRDMSERRAIEQMRREFIAMVGHELRNPLAALQGYATLIQRKGVYDPRAAERIVSQTRQLSRLVDDLLDTAQIDAGRLRLQRERASLLRIVRAGADEAADLSRAHQIKVVAPDEPLEGWWDSDRVSQVLRNVLSNAIKYSPAGGDVVVTVTKLNDQMQVVVTDPGLGIAPEALPRLFDPFYRAHGGLVDGPRGLGVGLYVSKALIEAHGGSLEVQSQPGQGTTVTLRLPVGKEPSRTPHAEIASAVGAPASTS